MKKLFYLFILFSAFCGVRALQAQDAALSVQLGQYLKSGIEQNITLSIINVSPVEIRSCEVSWSLNDGPVQSQTWNFQAGFAQNYQATVTHPRRLSLPTTGLHKFRIWISKLNGGADANQANSDLTINLKGLAVNVPKKVVFEKFTGAWCGHCPQANCDLKEILRTRSNFFAIDIHDGDAMENRTINGGMKSKFNVTGFPTAMIDRRILAGQTKAPLSPYVIYRGVDAFTQQSSPFSFIMTHTYNRATRDIEIKINAQAAAKLSGRFALNCAIVEDSIPGVGQGFAQTIFNQYTTDRNSCYFGQTSPMRNYFHMHVLRDYLGGVNGTALAKTSFDVNEAIEHTYRYKLPAQFNEKQIKLIAFIEGTDSDVNYTGIFNAEQRLLLLDSPSSVAETKNGWEGVQVYPNPTQGEVNISFEAAQNSPIYITLTNVLGQVVERSLYTPSLENTISLSLRRWEPGVYFLTIEQGANRYTQKIIYQP
jgi:hypothetical protein